MHELAATNTATESQIQRQPKGILIMVIMFVTILMIDAKETTVTDSGALRGALQYR
jgi:hypothetical protein